MEAALAVPDGEGVPAVHVDEGEGVADGDTVTEGVREKGVSVADGKGLTKGAGLFDGEGVGQGVSVSVAADVCVCVGVSAGVPCCKAGSPGSTTALRKLMRSAELPDRSTGIRGDPRRLFKGVLAGIVAGIESGAGFPGRSRSACAVGAVSLDPHLPEKGECVDERAGETQQAFGYCSRQLA